MPVPLPHNRCLSPSLPPSLCLTCSPPLPCPSHLRPLPPLTLAPPPCAPCRGSALYEWAAGWPSSPRPKCHRRRLPAAFLPAPHGGPLRCTFWCGGQSPGGREGHTIMARSLQHISLGVWGGEDAPVWLAEVTSEVKG